MASQYRTAKLAFGFSLLLVVLAIGVWNFLRTRNDSDPATDWKTAAEWGNLAPLPASATNVRTLHRRTPFWTAYHIAFAADKNAIEDFLIDSPGLKGKPQTFSAAHQYRDRPTGDTLGTKNLYFFENADVKRLAPWFDRTVTKSGRRFPIANKTISGEIVVNDETHTVYVYVTSG